MVQRSMVQHNLKLSFKQQQPPEATVIKSVTYKPQYLQNWEQAGHGRLSL